MKRSLFNKVSAVLFLLFYACGITQTPDRNPENTSEDIFACVPGALDPIFIDSSLLMPNKMESKTIPINFILMYYETMPPADINNYILSSIDSLNAAFDNSNIVFIGTQIRAEPLSHDFEMSDFIRSHSLESRHFNKLQIEAEINVFVLPGGWVYNEEQDLYYYVLGYVNAFDPEELSEDLNPDHNRIMLNYEGLKTGSVLVHEIGHFMGLYHYGNRCIASEPCNYMAAMFSEKWSFFSPAQIDTMKYIISLRSNLKFPNYDE